MVIVTDVSIGVDVLCSTMDGDDVDAFAEWEGR